MQQLFILVVGVFALGNTALVGSGPSPCKKGIKIDPAFSLKDLASKYQGTWPYAKALRAVHTDTFTWMFAAFEPTSTTGQYTRKVYYQAKNGTSGVFHTVVDNEGTDGGPVLTVTDTANAKTYFIKYGDGLAYYYVCNDDGVASGVDYRYVLSHGDLTPEQEKIVLDIENEYKFSGELKSFRAPH